MLKRTQNLLAACHSGVSLVLSGPQALAMLPAAILVGYWMGGEMALILLAIILPVCIAIGRIFIQNDKRFDNDDPDLDGAARIAYHAGGMMRQARRRSLKCACIFIEVDDFASLIDRYGQSAAEIVISQTQDRLLSKLRSRDRVVHVQRACFAVALAPVRKLDMEIGLQLCERLQSAIEEPIAIDASTVYVSASVGLAMSTQISTANGTELAQAGYSALIEARGYAPSAIRVFSTSATPSHPEAQEDDHIIVKALESGQIQPWFQPQISTDTGQITGFEALARWLHPDRGMISPAEFLPALERCNKMERLGELILRHSLEALKAWDQAGLNIPHVGVNFSPEELRNPRLLDKVKWELDRLELGPDRLMVEILENVVAGSPDDTVTRNINALAALGCFVDLDDFGTGHASISSIRRFAIKRLKIDRSFVMKVDQDLEQQRMVSAILLMAERLGLDTLAEGVETAGENAILAQLGCHHVQGFGISRPLPFDKTISWIESHQAKLRDPPVVGRKTG